MLRISLRAVDYATKAYALGSLEFALSAPSGRNKLEYLSQTIIATTQQLYETEELDDSQLGFIESARAISAALSSICQHAYEVSSHTVAHLRGGIHRSSTELARLGERANRILRLCIVAFMKQEVEYAEAVLRDIDEWTHGSKEESFGPECGASATITNDAHEWPIAASLAQIMENLCSIAVASLLPYRFHS
jgi:phosphate uptake regulator